MIKLQLKFPALDSAQISESAQRVYDSRRYNHQDLNRPIHTAPFEAVVIALCTEINSMLERCEVGIDGDNLEAVDIELLERVIQKLGIEIARREGKPT